MPIRPSAGAFRRTRKHTCAAATANAPCHPRSPKALMGRSRTGCVLILNVGEAEWSCSLTGASMQRAKAPDGADVISSLGEPREESQEDDKSPRRDAVLVGDSVCCGGVGAYPSDQGRHHRGHMGRGLPHEDPAREQGCSRIICDPHPGGRSRVADWDLATFRVLARQVSARASLARAGLCRLRLDFRKRFALPRSAARHLRHGLPAHPDGRALVRLHNSRCRSDPEIGCHRAPALDDAELRVHLYGLEFVVLQRAWHHARSRPRL